MKTAVVTGVSYGLGKSICEALLENNSKVYGISRTKPSFSDKNLFWIKSDLHNESEIKNLVNTIDEKKIDVLVNNVGTHIEELATDFSQETFHKIFDLNFLAPILITQALSAKLQNGFIINISSTSDRFVQEKSGLYSASKSALNIFFDVLAFENEGIKVLNILPDYVNTPLQHKLSDTLKDFDWDKCVKPEEIARFIRDILNNKYILKSGTRVIMVNNKSMNATRDPEKLYYYNVDSQELKKLK